MVAILHTCARLVEQDIDLKVTNKLCALTTCQLKFESSIPTMKVKVVKTGQMFLC